VATGQPVIDHRAQLVTDRSPHVLGAATDRIPRAPVATGQPGAATDRTPRAPVATGQLGAATDRIRLAPVATDLWAIDHHDRPVIGHLVAIVQPEDLHAVVVWVAPVANVVVAVEAADLADQVVPVAHLVAVSVEQSQVVAAAIQVANATQLIARAPNVRLMPSRAMGKDVDVAAKVARAQAFSVAYPKIANKPHDQSYAPKAQCN
jgi:hypothetical protein